MFDIERDKIFETLGWSVITEKPFKIMHDKSNSFATGEAALIVQDYLIENYKILKK
jgi:hypothetical protein